MITTVVSKKSPTIFICEPDTEIAQSLAAYLTAKGFLVRCIPESDLAIDQIIIHVPDIVLIDPLLPAAGGYEVCSTVRMYFNGHILFLGQNADEAAQLLAFERGADDYILIPVSPALLTARIYAHLKRSCVPVSVVGQSQMRVGKLMVDTARREVFLAGEPIALTTIQFELLCYLVKRSGRVIPREELYEALYRQKYNGFDRSVDVYVSRIRHLLGDDPENPTYLKTVRGVGYLFARDDVQSP